MAIPNWLHLSQLNGSGDTIVTITADTNEQLIERTGSLVISGITKSVTVPVLQMRSGSTIALSVDSLSFPASGGTSAVTYTAITTPTVYVSGDTTNRFSISVSGDTIYVTADAGYTTGVYSGTLVATAGGGSATASMTIDQVVFVTESPDTQYISSAETSGVFTITGNVDWYPISAGWLSVSDTSVRQANIQTQVGYTAEKNNKMSQRTGHIMAMYGRNYARHENVATVVQNQATSETIYVHYTTTNSQTINPPYPWGTTEYTSTGATFYKESTSSTHYHGLRLSGQTTLETVESTAKVLLNCSGCTSLVSVNIPNGEPNTNSGMFSGCISLTGITANSCTIMTATYSGCTSLQRFVSTYDSSDNPIYVENNAFRNCTSLQYMEFHCPRNAQIYPGSHPFNGVPSGGTLARPSGYDYSAITNELTGWTVVNV